MRLQRAELPQLFKSCAIDWAKLGSAFGAFEKVICSGRVRQVNRKTKRADGARWTIGLAGTLLNLKPVVLDWHRGILP